MPGETPALHELHPTTRFSDRAADYVRFRPDYPAAALDRVLDGLGPPGSLRAADVGAGTGISARQLAGRGVHVVAVEPNAEMRAAAAPHPRVTWREGTGEATGLGTGSVHLALCAQSFHWFRAPEALAELHRVLRPEGRLVLMWNLRDREDAFTHAYTEAIRAVNGEHPAERRAFDPDVVPATGLFAPLDRQVFAHAQELDLEGVVGRATSASYVPREGEAFEELRALLAAAFERHRDARGIVRLRYVTEVWRTRRP